MKRTDPSGTPRRTKITTFVILKNHASTPVIRERSSQTSKARTEPNRDRFMEKDGMIDRIKALEKSIAARTDRESGLGLLNPSEIDRERTKI